MARAVLESAGTGAPHWIRRPPPIEISLTGGWGFSPTSGSAGLDPRTCWNHPAIRREPVQLGYSADPSPAQL